MPAAAVRNIDVWSEVPYARNGMEGFEYSSLSGDSAPVDVQLQPEDAQPVRFSHWRHFLCVALMVLCLILIVVCGYYILPVCFSALRKVEENLPWVLWASHRIASWR